MPRSRTRGYDILGGAGVKGITRDSTARRVFSMIVYSYYINQECDKTTTLINAEMQMHYLCKTDCIITTVKHAI